MDIIQKNQIFRRKSLDTISLPEQLTSYLRVTTPGIWAVLTAVILPAFLRGVQREIWKRPQMPWPWSMTGAQRSWSAAAERTRSDPA